MSERKAVKDSDTFWQLEGESELQVTCLPDPPMADEPTTVRLTHSNVYGPFEGIRIFVRVGDPANPTDFADLDSHDDWLEADLIEEIVWVDDEEMLRSEAEEPFEDETPWDGTYEAQLILPKGKTSIEIKILSNEEELLASCVLSDWIIHTK